VKAIDPALLAHLQGRVTHLAVCWRVTRVDGQIVRGTQHDLAITIAAGTYAGTYPAEGAMTGSAIRSNADLSPDNLEVRGPVTSDVTLTTLRIADIEAGLYDDAEVVLFLCRWDDPDGGQLVLRSGNLGNIRHTSSNRYTAELRGLTQRLSQTTVRTYGVLCDAELGDTRCGVALGPLTRTGAVTTVASRRRFDATIASPGAAGLYVGGLLTFTSGQNANFAREVKRDAVGSTLGALELFEPMPRPIVAGDAFTIRPGCPKTFDACRDTFANQLNFRGHGHRVPGTTAMLQIGGQ
jgi:uncharacterized phage protein (TIGR02218 family)